MVDEEIEDVWVVYKITHIATGRAYYGCTGRWENRKKEHRRASESTKLHAEIRQYGSGAFLFEMVQECATRRKMHALERALIREQGTIWPAGFNMQKGGRGSLRDNLSAETRAKLTINGRRSLETPEAKAAHREGLLEAWSGARGDQRRKKMKEHWNDEDFRSRALSGLRRNVRWAPENAEKTRAFHSQLMTEINKARWQNPSYAAHMKVKRQEQVFTPEMRAKTSAIMKKRWATNPQPPLTLEQRARKSQATRAYYAQHPKAPESAETRAKKSAALKAYWAAKRVPQVAN